MAEYQIEIKNAGQDRSFPLFGKIRQNFEYSIFNSAGELQFSFLARIVERGYPTYEAALAAAKKEVARLESSRLERADLIKSRVIVDGAELLASA